MDSKTLWAVIVAALIVALLTSLITVKLTGNVVNVRTGAEQGVYNTSEIDVTLNKLAESLISDNQRLMIVEQDLLGAKDNNTKSLFNSIKVIPISSTEINISFTVTNSENISYFGLQSMSRYNTGVGEIYSWQSTALLGKASRSHVYRGLQPSKYYYYRMIVTFKDGKHSISPTFYAMTPP